MCRLRPASLTETVKKIVELKAMADLALSSGQYPDSLMAQIETEEEKLFNILWTADSIRGDEYDAVAAAILNGSLPYTSSALAIAAAGLSQMRYYSRDALMMLLSLAKAEDIRVSSRALSTLILALSRWPEESADDTPLKDALLSLCDSDGMPEKIRKVVRTAIRTRDTDRVSRKMQRDVIPGLMQFGPDINKGE